ncbi:MAG: 1,4-alpha-glucan branching protein GlgB [Stagnimonas sp.]|nr:1,4-alpha-glucan branching protein GlgB [Stagnimonas sp.]
MPASNDGPDSRLLIEAAAASALAAGEVGDPFAVLGPHPCDGRVIVRAFLPGALGVQLRCRATDRMLATLRPMQVDGLFAGFVDVPAPYCLHIRWPAAEGGETVQRTEDPYSFGVLLGALDLHLFAEGHHQSLAQCLGAQAMAVDGIDGVRFAVWAPHARRVSVVGPFNGWDGRRHPMRRRVENGVWELFLPRLAPGESYQYEILTADGALLRKADPLARQALVAPLTASVVFDPKPFEWHDAAWMRERPAQQAPAAPMSIYEVHAASWRRHPDDSAYQWPELAAALIPYVVEMGFTHIELLPVMAHPFGGSWGYQPLSLFAPQPEWGTPREFAAFVDACHAAGIGVLLDWVPAHFPDDAHGLGRFDGTALYEHADPREGFHRDWNTLIYNFGRSEVAGFLVASALHWLSEYHLDGLRVDAVASMLHRDYSRPKGEWLPNRFGGRENLEAVDFVRALNTRVQAQCPGALVIAEESTSWPGVTRPVAEGGLGFSCKWNLGWMNDTLAYAQLDPVYRSAAHERLTFGLMYAFDERFVLPLSHDEVVHQKGSLWRKQPGDDWQKFAGLRGLFGWMWAHPGKKLLFMGGELAQKAEWNHDRELDWAALAHAAPQGALHRGVQSAVRDLNQLYRTLPALHVQDDQPQSFEWRLVDARLESLFAFCRHAKDAAPILMVSNFTPLPRFNVTLGVPLAGRWREVFNSDAAVYGGSGLGNLGGVVAEATAHHGQPARLKLTAPPLATVWLVWEGETAIPNAESM